jgi:hypothetical protein
MLTLVVSMKGAGKLRSVCTLHPDHGGEDMHTWHKNWNNISKFLSLFDSEQDYVDAMFVHMIMFNFGVYMDHTMLMDGPEATGYLTGNEPRDHTHDRH